MKKITIARGLVSLINHNVKAKCPEERIVLDLDTMQIDTRYRVNIPGWDTTNQPKELVLFDENGGAIGYNTVTRQSLIDAAKRALAENGIDYKEA